MEVWNSLTDAQATIIGGIASGLLTVAAAVIGVMLGSRLFGGRVYELQGLLDTSNEQIASHSQAVSSRVDEITSAAQSLTTMGDRITSLQTSMRDLMEQSNAQFSAALESINQVRGKLTDASETLAASERAEGKVVSARDRIASSWGAIRDELEHIASDPNIDGRTRARYSRIDRRMYRDLIEALAQDGHLGRRAALVRDAFAIWQRFRTNRVGATDADAEKMAQLQAQIVPAQG